MGSLRYIILYTRTQEQQKVKDTVARYLTEAHGEVFCPCVEVWRRDKKQLVTAALFPGYIFLYTDIGREALHRIFYDHRKEMLVGVNELGLRRNRGDRDGAESEDADLPEISDVSEEEAAFLDFLRGGEGLLKMSCGYEEAGKCHVMEGPLKAYEDRITGLDKHNRRAFLNIRVGDRTVSAGFECKPKAHWYPKEDTKLAVLSDGSEVDLQELAKRMMRV